jgi:exopolyphosphatase/guanosine-5'-triphosphate,3'-diphosphate pyrophosphatase
LPGQRMAAVDIGTNSCRLLIADTKGQSITPILATLRTTRIGEGVEESGLLGEVPMERTIAALQEYLELIREYEVAHLRVVATSAVREAANAAFFVVLVREMTGITVDVISCAGGLRGNPVSCLLSCLYGRLPVSCCHLV